jgi:uncharacterized repeat protein (TIGR01451 family)
VGDDYGWPSNKYFDKPETWEEVTYGGASCVTEPSIDKADSADPVPAGQQFQYVLTVRNNGNNDAIGVGGSDPLPSTLVYDGYSAPAGVACVFTAGSLGCTIAPLPVKTAAGSRSTATPSTTRAAFSSEPFGRLPRSAASIQPEPGDMDAALQIISRKWCTITE